MNIFLITNIEYNWKFRNDINWKKINFFIILPLISFPLLVENNEQEVTYTMKRKDNPSKGAVSAASVKGNAGPGSERNNGKIK